MPSAQMPFVAFVAGRAVQDDEQDYDIFAERLRLRLINHPVVVEAIISHEMLHLKKVSAPISVQQ